MLTVHQAIAIDDMASYSRSVLTEETARRIASAFGESLETLDIAPQKGLGDVDFTEGREAGVVTSTLAGRLQKVIAPDHESEPCPFGGSGKSHDYWTFEALDGIRTATGYPDAYVSEKRGEPKRSPSGGYYVGSGEIIGYELKERLGDGKYNTLSEHATEMEAYLALVDYAEALWFSGWTEPLETQNDPA